jgi:hypothetical protein
MTVFDTQHRLKRDPDELRLDLGRDDFGFCRDWQAAQSATGRSQSDGRTISRIGLTERVHWATGDRQLA